MHGTDSDDKQWYWYVEVGSHSHMSLNKHKHSFHLITRPKSNLSEGGLGST